MFNDSDLDVCIMAGGSGSRLWPISRESYPKQFIKNNSDLSLFQSTALRVNKLNCLNMYVICNEQHRHIASSQLSECGIDNYTMVLESAAKGTTVAIAAISLFNKLFSKASHLCIVSSDHYIGSDECFVSDIKDCLYESSNYDVLLLGKKPTSPSTGFGYIKVNDNTYQAVQRVIQFEEKPDAERAQEYKASGEYFWNCGIFIFNVDKLLHKFDEFAPELSSLVYPLINEQALDGAFFRLHYSDVFDQFEESFDRALVEKLTNCGVKSLSSEWVDVGSWASYEKVFYNKADSGNKYIGEVEFYNTSETYVYSGGNKIIACLGINDIVVVDTPDATLVANKSDSEKIKNIVNDLKNKGYQQATNSKKNHRPWGAYDSIDNGPRHQVKRITVAPGQKLSLQKHYHRSEHWIVVSGSALVTLDKNEKLLTENESIYIPLGALHRLENPGNINLEIIEVQTGSYLGEDDIVRYDDSYGRK